ncbi:MAG: ABC transporter ATP-binding protein [Lachnospiraceae bacterium]|nr:ABC transporter ATP-binding protein [Lachnospiraceae bacterium]
MLKVSGIYKSYGKQQVLNDVSLEFENGIYGLLGANGAGKTTLLNIICGILKPEQGDILFDGTSIQKEIRNYYEVLGYMPQYATYYPNYTAKEFLKYMCVLKGIPKREQKEIIEGLLEKVNLKDTGKKTIGSFSGGMRQRLGIAQALLNNPKILILDEPTSGLDPKERIRFRNLISEIGASRIVIMATHIVQDIASIAKEVIILDKGNVVAQDTPLRLVESVEGKVFQISVPESKKEEVMKNGVRNLFFENDNCFMRIVSEEKMENAQPVDADLEDVFFYYTDREGS